MDYNDYGILSIPSTSSGYKKSAKPLASHKLESSLNCTDSSNFLNCIEVDKHCSKMKFMPENKIYYNQFSCDHIYSDKDCSLASEIGQQEYCEKSELYTSTIPFYSEEKNNSEQNGNGLGSTSFDSFLNDSNKCKGTGNKEPITLPCENESFPSLELTKVCNTSYPENISFEKNNLCKGKSYKGKNSVKKGKYLKKNKGNSLDLQKKSYFKFPEKAKIYSNIDINNEVSQSIINETIESNKINNRTSTNELQAEIPYDKRIKINKTNVYIIESSTGESKNEYERGLTEFKNLLSRGGSEIVSSSTGHFDSPCSFNRDDISLPNSDTTHLNLPLLDSTVDSTSGYSNDNYAKSERELNVSLLVESESSKISTSEPHIGHTSECDDLIYITPNSSETNKNNLGIVSINTSTANAINSTSGNDTSNIIDTLSTPESLHITKFCEKISAERKKCNETCFPSTSIPPLHKEYLLSHKQNISISSNSDSLPSSSLKFETSELEPESSMVTHSKDADEIEYNSNSNQSLSLSPNFDSNRALSQLNEPYLLSIEGNSVNSNNVLRQESSLNSNSEFQGNSFEINSTFKVTNSFESSDHENECSGNHVHFNNYSKSLKTWVNTDTREKHLNLAASNILENAQKITCLKDERCSTNKERPLLFMVAETETPQAYLLGLLNEQRSSKEGDRRSNCIQPDSIDGEEANKLSSEMLLHKSSELTKTLLEPSDNRKNSSSVLVLNNNNERSELANEITSNIPEIKQRVPYSSLVISKDRQKEVQEEDFVAVNVHSLFSKEPSNFKSSSSKTDLYMTNNVESKSEYDIRVNKVKSPDSIQCGNKEKLKERINTRQSSTSKGKKTMNKKLSKNNEFIKGHNYSLENKTLKSGNSGDSQKTENDIWCSDCNKFLKSKCSLHSFQSILDKPIQTRARASLPTEHLTIKVIQSGKDMGEKCTGVFARKPIPKRTQFGPLEGQFVAEAPFSNGLLFKTLCNNVEGYINTSEEGSSNWMRFVRPASTFSEINCVVIEEENKIFFLTIFNLSSKTELKIGYSKLYAEKFKLPLLEPSNDEDEDLNYKSLSSSDSSLEISSVYELNDLDKTYSGKDHVRNKIDSHKFPAENSAGSFNCERKSSKRIRTRSNPNLLSENAYGKISRVYDCPICHEKLNSVSSLKAHLPLHCLNGEYTCPTCSKVFPSYHKIRRHIRSYHSATHPCQQCGKTVPSLEKLKVHLLSHSDRRDFACHVCHKAFKRKDKMKEHLKRIHSSNNKKPSSYGNKNKLFSNVEPKVNPSDYKQFTFKCDLCMLGFKRRGMLVNHLSKRHPNIPISSIPELNQPILRTCHSYMCQYCFKVYVNSTKRKMHILKNHPGSELPPPRALMEEESSKTTRTYAASCPFCPRQYATKAKLLQHQRRFHNEVLKESEKGSNNSRLEEKGNSESLQQGEILSQVLNKPSEKLVNSEKDSIQVRAPPEQCVSGECAAGGQVYLSSQFIIPHDVTYAVFNPENNDTYTLSLRSNHSLPSTGNISILPTTELNQDVSEPNAPSNRVKTNPLLQTQISADADEAKGDPYVLAQVGIESSNVFVWPSISFTPS